RPVEPGNWPGRSSPCPFRPSGRNPPSRSGTGSCSTFSPSLGLGCREQRGVEEPELEPALADEQRVVESDREGADVVGEHDRAPEPKVPTDASPRNPPRRQQRDGEG